MLLFGLCSDAAPTVKEEVRRALAALPKVRHVQHYADPACVLAAGFLQDRPHGHVFARREAGYVVLDGWVANRAEIGRALALSDSDATSRTDADLVAEALARWGHDALARLHGDFAIMWWRPQERRLLLACDRTGGRPLFYHTSKGRLGFANLVSAIFASADIPRRLNADMVAAVGLSPQFMIEDTCFAGVKQLLPGYRLDWSPARGAQVSRYWELELSRRICLPRDGDYVEAARDLLDTVVGEATRGEGALAATLSGGLDSAAVAATAARLTAPARLVTLTLRPDPASPLPACNARSFQDEWSHARAVARMHPSMEAHAVNASLDGMEQTLRSGFYWMGRPSVHLLAPVWMRAAWRRARELGATRVLTGLSGNGTLSASALPHGLRPTLRDWPAAMHAMMLAASLGRSVSPFARALAPGWMRDLRRRLAPGSPFWQTRSGLRAEIGGHLGAGAMWDAFLAGDRRAPFDRRARLRTIENTWLLRTNTAGLRFRDGIERPDPLGDVRLAEFCLAIPSRQFTRWGADRYLARRALADRLPPEVLHEQRIGRQNPEWFGWATQCRDWMAAEIEGIDASPLGRELFDIPRLRRVLAAWPTDATAAEPHYQEVMNVLGRSVAVGGFIRWAEGRNL